MLFEEFEHCLPEFARTGVQLAGVSTDPWLINRRFRAAAGLDFPLLSDWPAGATCEAFGVLAPDGRARRVTAVFTSDGRVLEVIEGAAPAEHPQLALDALITVGTRTGEPGR